MSTLGRIDNLHLSRDGGVLAFEELDKLIKVVQLTTLMTDSLLAAQIVKAQTAVSVYSPLPERVTARIVRVNEVLELLGTTGRCLTSINRGLAFNDRCRFEVGSDGHIKIWDSHVQVLRQNIKALGHGYGVTGFLTDLFSFILGLGPIEHHAYAEFGYGDDFQPIHDLLINHGIMKPKPE